MRYIYCVLQSVKAQLYNVLVFPEGGWLVDLEMEDALRQQQMKSLRSLCIPKVNIEYCCRILTALAASPAWKLGLLHFEHIRNIHKLITY